MAYLLLVVSIFYYEDEYAFEVCVLTCLLHGAAHAFGESVLIGFFKFFPSDAIYIFSSGTGFSDVFAIIMIMVFNNVGIFYG
jgi:hypothetical protein